MKKKIIVANWKMNPDSPEKAREIFAAAVRAARKLKHVSLVVCPPALYAGLFKKPSERNIFLGLQDVFWEKGGAHTGEVGAGMARAFGISYAIIGHSERRRLGETDEVVSKKVLAALQAGLRPIVCIGEAERDADGAYFNFLKNQIRGSLASVRPQQLKEVIIAYEPLWAIGKSFKDAMKPPAVHETAIFIRKVLADMFTVPAAAAVPVLYGGSVDAENAGPIVSEGRVDGLLVGRQSLDSENFPKLLSILNGL